MQRLVTGIVLLAVALIGGRFAAHSAGGGTDPQRARIVRVIDGDTVKVRIGGRRETVRLIGIDTPESKRPGTPVECGSRAAARALRRRAITADGRGRTVDLVADPTQDRRDRYDRLLAYVDLAAGGTDLGEAQVRDGWAAVYVYDDTPFTRLGRYEAAAASARAHRRGVHESCRGDFHRVP